MAITSLLQDKSLNFSFINDNNEREHHDVYFYQRNPTRRGIDFTGTKYIKFDFLRYVVKYHCQNPIADIKKRPLPVLEELCPLAALCRPDPLIPHHMFPRGSLHLQFPYPKVDSLQRRQQGRRYPYPFPPIPSPSFCSALPSV